MAPQLILFAALLLLVFWATYTYRQLLALHRRIDALWRDIGHLLQRRLRLVPALEAAAQQYASPEASVLAALTKAQSAVATAATVSQQVSAHNALSSALSALLAGARATGHLEQAPGFTPLHQELVAVDTRLVRLRRSYNDEVMAFNTMLQSFPANMVASMGRFSRRPYFEMDSGAASTP